MFDAGFASDGAAPDAAGDPTDGAEPRDTGGDPPDLGVDADVVGADAEADAGLGPDGAADAEVDAGPPRDGGLLIEDFSNPTDVIFICADGTRVETGTIAEQGLHCLGIDATRCPEVAGFDGPDSVRCDNPAYNPFAGAGVCVRTFFSCFDPAGACLYDEARGAYDWQSGASQEVDRDQNGAILEARFIAAGAARPCIVARPDTSTTTRMLYSR